MTFTSLSCLPLLNAGIIYVIVEMEPGFVHARQALCHLSYILDPVNVFVCSESGSYLIAQG